MGEIKKELSTYILQYACDDCEKTSSIECILVNEDRTLSYPHLYIYECPNCKKEYKFSKYYSKLYYE